MEHPDGTVEQLLARMAFHTFGLVRRGDLLRAGVTPEEIRRRLLRGTLLREHRGVYRVGHRAPSMESRYLAAVWACGEGALLYAQAAGHLLGILKGAMPRPQVMAPTKRRVDGVVTHRYRALHPEDATVWRNIPVTSVARTLVDLAAVLGRADLARACHEAGVRHGTTPAEVERVLARRRSPKGAGKLRAIIRGDERVVLSKLEARFLELLREADLPLPVTNRVAGERRVDCRWPEHRLTVELDSYRYHGSRHAWEADRRREREAYARGDQFRRYTWGDVFETPGPILGELNGLLRESHPT